MNSPLKFSNTPFTTLVLVEVPILWTRYRVPKHEPFGARSNLQKDSGVTLRLK